VHSSSSASSPGGFAAFGLRPEILRGIAAAGFSEPRPIQVQTLPAVLAGRDVLGLAQTGTGKTAAFALPILERLLAERRPGPRALVLAPTRELCVQIAAELRTLAGFTKLSAVTLHGGVSPRTQIDALARRPDVVVACPGRLLDLLRQRHARLGGVEVLVIDEADHMFDIGFLPDVRRILAALPARRQNLLFSATMPAEVRHLADELLSTPHVVELDHRGPAATIEHALYPVPEQRKHDLLEHLLAGDGFASAIVFTRTKHRARRLAEQLGRSGHRAVALQGNMSQSQRDRAMQGFRAGRFDVLVATDLAARGIDVANVSHVINFDMPNTPHAYTHRIGRTGRAECEGKAITFVTADDRAMVRSIERTIGAPIARCQVAGFEQPAPSRSEPTPRPGAARPRSSSAGGGPRNGGIPRRGRGRRPRRSVSTMAPPRG
jgi:ATP-dependent RNA helicase RhlE